MARLTRKQKEVVTALQKTGGMVSEFCKNGCNPIVEVVVEVDDMYDVVLPVHKRTFKALLSKGVIRYLPNLMESNYENWRRGWYELNPSFGLTEDKRQLFIEGAINERERGDNANFALLDHFIKQAGLSRGEFEEIYSIHLERMEQYYSMGWMEGEL